MKSNFILADVLQKLQVFNPIVIYIDDKLIWDDRKSHEDGWIPIAQLSRITARPGVRL